MKSKKLLGVIIPLASIAAVAAAVCLIISTLSADSKKDSNKADIHSLSGNEAVSMGLSNMLSDISDLSGIIDAKTETDITLNIYELMGFAELSGLEISLNVKNDGVNDECSLTANAILDSTEIFSGDLYADSTQIIGYIPTLYAGTIVMPYEFLDKLESMTEDIDTEDIDTENGTIETFDIENITLPEFDYEAFATGLMASMEESINTTAENIAVENLDMQPLSGGNYYCYKASIPVEDLANILKAGILYSLNNEELQAFVDAVYPSTSGDMTDDELSDDLIYDYDIDMSTQMSSYAMILDSYWPMIVAQLEVILGTNIEFTVYLTDDVDLVGYELSAPNLFSFSADFTAVTADSNPVSYFDFICYSEDTTLVNARLSVSSKEFASTIEKPSTEPIINLGELTDEQLSALMDSLSGYTDYVGDVEPITY